MIGACTGWGGDGRIQQNKFEGQDRPAPRMHSLGPHRREKANRVRNANGRMPGFAANSMLADVSRRNCATVIHHLGAARHQWGVRSGGPAMARLACRKSLVGDKYASAFVRSRSVPRLGCKPCCDLRRRSAAGWRQAPRNHRAPAGDGTGRSPAAAAARCRRHRHSAEVVSGHQGPRRRSRGAGSRRPRRLLRRPRLRAGVGLQQWAECQGRRRHRRVRQSQRLGPRGRRLPGPPGYRAGRRCAVTGCARRCRARHVAHGAEVRTPCARRPHHRSGDAAQLVPRPQAAAARAQVGDRADRGGR